MLPEHRTAQATVLPLLRPLCKEVEFKAGEVLRQLGQHYREMYVIVDGCVEVDRGNSTKKREVSDIGTPIGEISYLQGRPATARVIARTTTRALVIDDATLARLEAEQPGPTAEMLRHFAKTADERLGQDLIWDAGSPHYDRAGAIEVYLCRDAAMLEAAKRLRYEVYCRELGRQSPYADHDRKTISDQLDDTGLVFVAVEAGEIVGTLRANISREGPLGVLEELYGMKASPHHPDATGICTKFIVKKAKRGGPASMKLIAAVVRYGLRNTVRECYIDSIPALLPYYKALGFTITAEKFVHRENGLSYPMKLDLTRHGSRLSKDAGLLTYLNLFARAKLIRMMDRARSYAGLAPSQ